jgi:hypothetical protein
MGYFPLIRDINVRVLAEVVLLADLLKRASVVLEERTCSVYAIPARYATGLLLHLFADSFSAIQASEHEDSEKPSTWFTQPRCGQVPSHDSLASSLLGWLGRFEKHVW